MVTRKFFIAALALVLLAAPALAYVEIPYTAGRLIAESNNIVLVRMEKVDKERNLILYRKVKDIKGTHPQEVIKHNIGRGGFHPREWQNIMAAAEVGKLAVFMHNGSASETCIDNYWYQAYPGGDWWNMSHAEPYLLGLGQALHALGEYEQAAAALSAIPANERTGELAGVPYLLADCIIRTTPTGTEDALAAARLIQRSDEAANLLAVFISNQENNPLVPDALLKIGSLKQKVAAAIVDPEEKRKALKSAREAYERMAQRFSKHPQFAESVYEHAKVLAAMGDFGSAVSQLSRFNNDPLKNAPIAPLALVQMAEYMRVQGRAAEAVTLLKQLRQKHEATLLQDPARAPWVAAMQHQLGLALKDSGKFAEARDLFEALAKQFPDRPEALEASWRVGQSRKEEAIAKSAEARDALFNAPPRLRRREKGAGDHRRAGQVTSRHHRIPQVPRWHGRQ